MCKIFLKIKMQESTCRELLEYFVNCHVDARSKILHARSKLEKSQKQSETQHNELLSIGNMKHSETLTLRKMKVKTSQMEAWNTQKLSPSGNETFSIGSMKRSEILTPRKMDMNNSQMETWEILTLRKMKMKILTLRCMPCVVQEKKNNQPTFWRVSREDAHMFFFNVWCCVLCTRKQICLIHNKGYTFSNVCCFFPQCLALCSANEKNERYQMNKWMFFKRVDDVMPAAYFFKTKTCAVYDKQMEFIKAKTRTVQFCECFWWPARVFAWEELMIFCLLGLSDAFWEILIFCWPFFQKKIVVSWFIDYCSLPVLALKKWTCMWNTTAWILDNCKLVHDVHA